MPTRKYRLAAPVDYGQVDAPYLAALPIASSRRYRLAKPNDFEPNSKQNLFKNKKPVEKSLSNPSPRWWLVLPCVLLMTLASASDPLVMNDLIVRRYERRYGLPTSAGAQRVACLQSTTTSAPTAPLMYWQIPSAGQNLAPTSARL